MQHSAKEILMEQKLRLEWFGTTQNKTAKFN